MIAAAIIAGLVLCLLLAFRSARAALAASPFVTVALVIFSARWGSVAGMAASPLVFLATLAAILLFRPDPDAAGWPEATAKWLLIGLAFFASLWVTFALGVGAFGVFGLLFWIGFGMLVLRSAKVSREAVAAEVISTIGSAMRQNLPLAGALSAEAEGRTGARASTLRKISTHLAQGAPLGEALGRGFRACPGHVLGVVTTAEGVGQLPAAIETLQEELARKSREGSRFRAVHPLYPAVVLFVAFVLLVGLQVVILPKYEVILDHFGSELPAPTQALMGSSLAGRALLPMLAVICLVAAVVSIWVSFQPRRPGRPGPLSRMGDFIKWHLPVFHWFERSRSLLRAVRLLRLSLKAGCTIDQAIAGTLDLDLNARFRRRLRRWLEAVRRGEDASAAAGKCRLGRALAWAFDRQVNPNTAPQALEALETFFRSNYNYKANLVKFASWPCATIALAGFVGYVVYAMFLPLVWINRSALQGVIP